MPHILEILEHTILDTVKLVPFLYLTYLAMEILEHKAADKMQNVMRSGGRLGPVLGGMLGVVPQCGFSAAASSLYAGRVITLGTLIAIFLSTSDEMLPILISDSNVGLGAISKILLLKIGIGIVAGFICDAFFRKLVCEPVHHHEHSHEHDHEKHGHGQETVCDDTNHDAHNHEEHEHSHDHGHEHEHGHSHDHATTAIHELCEQDHCHCGPEGNVFLSALIHTAKITLFILGISFVLNLVLHTVGEDALKTLFLNKPVISELVAGLVGLIPNCASSVVLTQLYVEGAISFAACMTGLLVGSGVGILVLFRTNRHLKENIKILVLLYGIGVAAGLILELIPAGFWA